MNLKVYHQLGHNHKWNVQSYREDAVGDGLILPARYMEDRHIKDLEAKLLHNSIFDPQFYVPRTARGALSTYDFFPANTVSDFSTSDYSNAALESAIRCVLFQQRYRFEYTIIPTRYKSGMPTNFEKEQSELFIEPFLEALSLENIEQRKLLQLILNDDMLKDEEYAKRLLNWITSYPEITGVYLIVQTSGTRKQIQDANLLLGLLEFIDNLNSNRLEVVLGYLNTESFLLSIAMPTIVTIGTYEATRSFDASKFEDLRSQPQYGPNPRLYISKLLQWVEKPYVDLLKSLIRDNSIFDENHYQAEMFEPEYNWHFSKPELYKHALLVMYNQLRTISDLSGIERYTRVDTIMRDAHERYQMLAQQGMVFDPNSGGDHLPIWISVAAQFAQKRGWR